VAAILLVFRDELHAHGPHHLNKAAEPVTECGFWGDMDRDVLPMTEKHPKRPRDPNQFAKAIIDICDGLDRGR
jgi:hypothetical protein